MLDTTTTPPPPDGIHLLADHLDAALAAGEDLLAVRLAPAADASDGQSPDALLAGFVVRLRQHEAALLLRLLQARRRAAEIRSAGPGLKSALKLIGANTDSLLGLVQHYGNRDAESFRTGEDLQLFLRARGLIAADAAGVSPFEPIRVGEAYLVGGILPLSGLMDMTAAALDLLDRQFDLFRDEIIDDDTIGGPQAIDAAATEPAATSNPEPLDADEIVIQLGELEATMAADVATNDKLSPGSLRAALRALAEPDDASPKT